MRYFGLYLAWLISLIATFFSLYLSVIKRIPPCELCWYLRICLFPLVIILGQAAYCHFRAIVPFVIALPLIGMLLSIYQLIFALTHNNALCIGSSECVRLSSSLFNSPIAIPILGILAFALINLFLLLAKRKA